MCQLIATAQRVLAALTTFLTIEDETGFVNVILHQAVLARFPAISRTEYFLGIAGRVQRQDGVMHVIASSLWVPDLRLRPAEPASRDFH